MPRQVRDHTHLTSDVFDPATDQTIDEALQNLSFPPDVVNEFVTNIAVNETFVTEITTNETFVTELTENQTFIEETVNQITQVEENNTYITQITENNTFVTNVTQVINANINGKKGAASELASLNASGDIPAAQIPDVLKVHAIQFVIDGSGLPITAGVKGDIEVPWAATITAWRVFADQSGSITVGVWKDSYANFPPVVGDLLVSPALSSAAKAESTGLSLALAAGDILRFNANATPATVTRVTVSLTVLLTVPA